MDMAMVIMANQKSRNNRVRTCHIWLVGLGAILMVGIVPAGYTRDWTMRPSINLTQMYSDNINLRPPALAQDSFVTLVSPSIYFRRDGARSTFNFSYRLQYMIYEGSNYSPTHYNQMQMNSKTELIDESLYLDSTSTISQVNSSATGAFAVDNVSRSLAINSSEYRTFRLSPYWRVHLGGYVEGEVRVGYTHFGNGNITNTVTGANSIGNLGSNGYQESIYLSNGRHFDAYGVSWRMNLYNYQQDNNSGSTAGASSTTRFRSASSEITYRLIDKVSAFVQAGYYDNAYPGVARTGNGTYIIPGLTWNPSQRFSLSAGYGINAYFSNLTWHPSQRTCLQVNYRNSQVGGGFGYGGGYGGGYGLSSYGGGFGGSSYSSGFGYPGAGASVGCVGSGSSMATSGGAGIGTSGSVPGTGQIGGVGGVGSIPGANIGQIGNYSTTGNLGSNSIGSTWNGSFQHTTRSTTLTASYITSTSTIQQLLANTATFVNPTDLNGVPTGTPIPNNRSTILPNVENGIIVSKRMQVTGAYFTQRSKFMLTGFQGNYSYPSYSGSTQDVMGVSASWTWLFSPRMSSTLFAMWQNSETKSTGSPVKTDFYMASWSLNRQLSTFMNASLQLRHIESSSNNQINNSIDLLSTGSYSENRATAMIYFLF